MISAPSKGGPPKIPNYLHRTIHNAPPDIEASKRTKEVSLFAATRQLNAVFKNLLYLDLFSNRTENDAESSGYSNQVGKQHVLMMISFVLVFFCCTKYKDSQMEHVHLKTVVCSLYDSNRCRDHAKRFGNDLVTKI